MQIEKCANHAEVLANVEILVGIDQEIVPVAVVVDRARGDVIIVDVLVPVHREAVRIVRDEESHRYTGTFHHRVLST